MVHASFQETVLGEILDFYNGKSIKPGGEGKYPVYGSNGIIGYSDEYKYSNALIIGRVGAYCGSIEYCKSYFWASDNTIVTKPKDETHDVTFLYYLLKELNLNRHAGGAAQPLITQGTLKQVTANVPPLPTQRKIASILSAYDDLIENNTRRIKVLEEMAQMIYREWFVKFRFPGHEKVKMVDSPIGRIPEGWEVKQISDVADIHRGRSYKSSELLEEGGLSFLNLKCIERDGGFRHDGIKRYQGPYKETQKAYVGDIIMAVTDMTQERRLVARAARVPNNRESFFIFSMDLVKIAPFEEIPNGYLYCMLRYSEFADQVKQYANGANVLHLNPSHIADFQFALPPKALRLKFASICNDLLEECDLLQLKNINLRKTRDLLLPRLISGEVGVEGLEILTES